MGAILPCWLVFGRLFCSSLHSRMFDFYYCDRLYLFVMNELYSPEIVIALLILEVTSTTFFLLILLAGFHIDRMSDENIVDLCKSQAIFTQENNVSDFIGGVSCAVVRIFTQNWREEIGFHHLCKFCVDVFVWVGITISAVFTTMAKPRFLDDFFSLGDWIVLHN